MTTQQSTQDAIHEFDREAGSHSLSYYRNIPNFRATLVEWKNEYGYLETLQKKFKLSKEGVHTLAKHSKRYFRNRFPTEGFRA